MSNQSSSLLAGIKILDLSRILAGPWATQLLADYGAEVWKIEHPQGGDDTRHWGPPWVELDGERTAAYFVAANRNKQSFAIDLKTEQGRMAIVEMAKQADVFVENFKVNDMKKMGLDYQTLRQLNPQLIYCSITGFGQTGPAASNPGYDAMIQASGGLMSITGVDHDHPTKVGVAVADIMTGMYAANAILAALLGRERGCEGQHIDIALMDCQLSMLANQAANFLATGISPQPMGNAHPNIVPYQTFICADGQLMLAVGNDSQFAKLCSVLGLSELLSDPKFKTNEARVEHRQQVIDLLQRKFKQENRNVWIDMLTEQGIPCGPVNNIAEALAQPQVEARAMVKSFSDCDITYIPNPVKFSRTPVPQAKRPPKLGEHD